MNKRMISRIRTLSILNFIAFVLAFLVSNLSQWGLLGLNNTMATVSAKYESVFTPAGITFAIWGIIYISLFGFCIYHLFQAFTQHADQRVNQDVYKMGWLFVINNAATILWVHSWLSEMLFFSVLLMFIQLFSLLFVHIRLELFNPRRALLGKAFSQFPLSIYFAWICVATVANTSAYLVSIGWDACGISPENWAIIMIGVVTLISLFMIFIRKNPFFGMVILWAFYGIILKRRQIDADLYADVILAARSAFILIAISTILQLIKNFRSRPRLH
jgi:hypothetical protein